MIQKYELSRNPIEKPYQTEETFPIAQITAVFKIRSLQPDVVAQIVTAIQTEGFYPDGHLILNRENGTIELIAGNHRYEAAKQAGLTTLPVILYDNLTHEEKLRIARQSNNNAETIAKTSFVDDVEELVWKELKREGMTAEQLAAILPDNFGINKIRRFAALEYRRRGGKKSGICPKAWRHIKASNFSPQNDKKGQMLKSEEGEAISPQGKFNEKLLRSIIPLRRKYQLLLVQAFTHPEKDKRITAGKFKSRAEGYRYQDEMLREVFRHTGRVSYTLTKEGFREILSGGYDASWKTYKTAKKRALKKQTFEEPLVQESPQRQVLDGEQQDQRERQEVLQKPKYYDTDGFLLPDSIQTLIHSLKEQAAIQLICGDFYEEIQKLPDASVDLVLTDPPYNISYDREFVREDRSNLSRDFGEERYSPKEFIALFEIWATEFYRILRPRGSGYVFCSHRYLSHLEDAFERAGFTLREPIYWCKLNPPPQIQKITYRPSVESIVFFTKGAHHTFNWREDDENEMFQYKLFSICQGKERRLDKNKNTLHPNQKPESLIEFLMGISSHQGHLVFDGFMGVGTVPAVAKRLRRHCIGIEQKKIFFEDAQRRVNDVKP